MSETKRQRNSIIELLRILCILMVIAGHYYAHGIAYAMAPFGPETYSLRILALQLISQYGELHQHHRQQGLE